jgi:hypothetical protein
MLQEWRSACSVGRLSHCTIAEMAGGAIIDRLSARIFDLDQRPSLTPKYRLLLRHFPARSTLPSAHGVPKGSGHVQGPPRRDTPCERLHRLALLLACSP